MKLLSRLQSSNECFRDNAFLFTLTVRFSSGTIPHGSESFVSISFNSSPSHLPLSSLPSSPFTSCPYRFALEIIQASLVQCEPPPLPRLDSSPLLEQKSFPIIIKINYKRTKRERERRRRRRREEEMQEERRGSRGNGGAGGRGEEKKRVIILGGIGENRMISGGC